MNVNWTNPGVRLTTRGSVIIICACAWFLLAGQVSHAQDSCPSTMNGFVRERQVSQLLIIRERCDCTKSIFRTTCYWNLIGQRTLTPTPTPTPTPSQAKPTPTPTAKVTPVSLSAPTFRASVNVPVLNLRSGPGQEHAVLAKLLRGAIVTVVEQNGAWYRVTSDQGEGWVSARLVTPVSSAPSEGQSPSPGGLLSDFETWGSWRRGDETWGTFVQSNEQHVSGRNAGKLTYDFPADPKNYVVFRRLLPINGRPNALRLQVYGDGSTHFLNAWVQDARGQLWQFTFGRINHTGWRTMTAPFDLGLDWPNQAVGAAKTNAPIYPLRFYALVLDGHASDQAFQGVIYLDDLEAVGP